VTAGHGLHRALWGATPVLGERHSEGIPSRRALVARVGVSLRSFAGQDASVPDGLIDIKGIDDGDELPPVNTQDVW
jgi:hypothetical protein